MDRTSWKPKIYKATETVDYKAEESICPQCNSSDTRKMELDLGGTGYVGKDSGIRKYDDYLEQCNNCGKIFTDGSESKANEEGTSDGAKKGWLTRQRGGSAEEPEKQSSRDKEFYDESTQNTLDTLNQSKVNGFPFFSYVGQPEKIISDGKGGIILYGMKRNPNNIRRVDVKYDEGRDTYTVSFMSNRNKPKGEYNDVYFDQLGGLIAGNKGLGVESYATEDDYKYDWDQLTSLAQKALSNIGYDKKSWNQEPEDIRKEMEKVAYLEENWKEVANKFYKEELNKGKKNGGEAQPAYGYGSATGRMSPVEAWNQGADVYGDMGYDPSLRNPIFTDFRGLKWNELPTDIQEAWKSELGYYTQGEGLVDNIEKQLNRFGVNLDRDPEQINSEESVLEKVNVNGWDFSVIDHGYGGGWADTTNTGTYEVGIFAPNGQESKVKGWLTQEEVDDLKRTFEVNPVMAYRRIGGEWEEDWQKGFESKANEGFNQGLYGYVDAKCKTCGIEFDSISDMNDHYAMNSDHVSNLNDLDSDIPNSD